MCGFGSWVLMRPKQKDDGDEPARQSRNRLPALLKLCGIAALMLTFVISAAATIVSVAASYHNYPGAVAMARCGHALLCCFTAYAEHVFCVPSLLLC